MPKSQRTHVTSHVPKDIPATGRASALHQVSISSLQSLISRSALPMLLSSTSQRTWQHSTIVPSRPALMSKTRTAAHSSAPLKLLAFTGLPPLAASRSKHQTAASLSSALPLPLPSTFHASSRATTTISISEQINQDFPYKYSY